MKITSATDVALEIAKQTEDRLMRQLEWLVSRGILVIESKPGKFLQQDLQPDSDGRYRISYHQEIELKSKEHEYIEKLESALSWYADEYNWTHLIPKGDPITHVVAPIGEDRGYRAREALGRKVGG